MEYRREKRRVPFLPLVLILFWSGILLFCNEKELELKNITITDMQGKWKISNQDPEGILDFSRKPGYVIYQKQGEEYEFILLNDGEGLRIQSYESTQPEGYFLWNDKRGNTWTGIWKDELVRLIYLNPIEGNLQ